MRQLRAWGLEEVSHITELVVSELVTNAIRYGGVPIRLRLIRDGTLICEVSDASSTAPHLRRARVSDEGGRGLHLVAQLTQRWGTRQTADGQDDLGGADAAGRARGGVRPARRHVRPARRHVRSARRPGR